MADNQIDKQIAELTLMLMYLTSWKESAKPSLRLKPASSDGEIACRCWKGYDHTTLDILSQQGYISDRHTRMPLFIYFEGERKAQDLLKKYGISIDEA